MIKKKYHGIKTGVLLLFFLLNVCVLSTTSFANTSQLVMSSGELDTFFDSPNRVGVCSYFSNTNSSSVTYFNTLLNRIGKERFLTFFNSNVLSSINSNSNLTGINLMKQQITFIFDKGVISSQNSCRIHVFISNNQIGNDFGYIKLNSRTNFYRLSASTDNIYYCVISIDFSISNNLQVSPTTALSPGSSGFDFYISQISTRSDRDLISISGFIGYKAIQNIYYNDLVYLLNDYIIEYVPEPEQPSGDMPSNSGLGDITNSSGDNGGNINLQPIQQGLINIQNQISGDTQKVIENQNQNTQTIVNTISGEVSKINNTLTDTSVNVDISGELSSMVSSANIDDPTSNFFSWLLDELRLVFTETTEQTIEFDFLTKHIVISTNDFIMPDSDFKSFLSLSFTAWFGFSIVKKIHYIVYAVKCVKINDAMKQIEFNPNLL